MRFALALATAMVGTSSLAHALEEQPRYGVELRFGPFEPKISNNQAERDFYELIYNPPQNEDDSLFEFQPLMKTLELDYYFFTDFGLLGVTGSAGHWSIDGRTRTCPDADDGATCTPETVSGSLVGNDTTSLTMVPLTGGIVYRFDAIKRRYSWLPFVPYAKAGLSYTFWWARTPSGTSQREGLKGRGGQIGYYGSVGIALNLDWIEPGTSQKARLGSGIADTYLFFDANLFESNGFSDRRLDLSDTFFQAGLSVDMF